MEKVMLRLFGQKPVNKEKMAPIRLKTTFPKQTLTYEQWLKEFNVSRMWDRKIVHINN